MIMFYITVKYCGGSMCNVLHWLQCLHTWSPAAGAVWEGCGSSRRWSISRESGSLGGPGGAGVPFLLTLCLLCAEAV